MLIVTPDGRHLEIRRRWLPWRLRKRRVDLDFNPLHTIDGADDLAGIAAGLVAGLVLFLFGGIILTVALFASEALLLLLLLVPLSAALRFFWVLPWIIEVTGGNETLGTERVRGWRGSEDRLREIAIAYEQGQDPFGAAPRAA